LFTPAVQVLRIFATLPPILAVTHSVGVQWLFSQKRDSLVNTIMLSAGVFNILLAASLAPRWRHFGMAWAVVCAEVLACVLMVWAVQRTAPFWKRQTASLGSSPGTDTLHPKTN
jgi:polysaccharide transporter, PST family